MPKSLIYDAIIDQKSTKVVNTTLERNFPMNRTIPVRIRFRRIFRELVGSKVFTVWKLRKFTLTLLLQKFRESNVLLMNSLNS